MNASGCHSKWAYVRQSPVTQSFIQSRSKHCATSRALCKCLPSHRQRLIPSLKYRIPPRGRLRRRFALTISTTVTPPRAEPRKIASTSLNARPIHQLPSGRGKSRRTVQQSILTKTKSTSLSAKIGTDNCQQIAVGIDSGAHWDCYVTRTFQDLQSISVVNNHQIDFFIGLSVLPLRARMHHLSLHTLLYLAEDFMYHSLYRLYPTPNQLCCDFVNRRAQALAIRGRLPLGAQPWAGVGQGSHSRPRSNRRAAFR